MAVLFDLDGTLIDTANDIIWAINVLCVELNKPLADVNLLKDNVNYTEEDEETLYQLQNEFEYYFNGKTITLGGKAYPWYDLYDILLNIITEKTNDIYDIMKLSIMKQFTSSKELNSIVIDLIKLFRPDLEEDLKLYLTFL